MSDENGNTPEEKGTDAMDQKENTAVIKNGIMTVVLNFENDSAAFAKAIGSLELAKDLVKNYFGKKAMVDSIMKERSTLIRPNGAPKEIA